MTTAPTRVDNKPSPTLWAVAIFAAAGAGAAAMLSAEAVVRGYSGAQDCSAGLALPIPVINCAAQGWWMVGALWTMALLLGLCGWRLTRALADSPESPRRLFGIQTALLVALTFLPLTLSADIYYYAAYARIFGVHGINPYVLNTPLSLASDPALKLSLAALSNPPYPDPYGPLWTLLAGLIGRLESGATLWLQLWTQRILAVGAALAATFGLWYILRRLSWRERCSRIGAFAFNPLAVYEAAVGAHNDVIMVALGIWAFALVDEMPLYAGLLLGASISIKYASLVALPFFFLKARHSGWLRAGLASLLALAVPLVCFAPFWSAAHMPNAAPGGGPPALAMSPMWMVEYRYYAAGLVQFVNPIRNGFLIVFAIIALVSIWEYARRGRAGALWRTIAALVWTQPAIHPWYVLWLSPAIAGGGAWATYAWWFAALVFLRYPLETVAQNRFPLPLQVAFTCAFLLVPVLIARLRRAAPVPA